MRFAFLSAVVAVFCSLPSRAEDKKSADKDEGWISIFDGKTLKGWKASEKPENWTVEDGCIVGQHDRSHLFYMEREFTDLEFKAEEGDALDIALSGDPFTAAELQAEKPEELIRTLWAGGYLERLDA